MFNLRALITRCITLYTPNNYTDYNNQRFRIDGISIIAPRTSEKESVTTPRFPCYTELQRVMKRIQRNKSGKSNAKKIVNIRLRPDQEAKIDALVRRSAILDTSKVVRIAVDWLLMSDIGEVLTKIVNPQAFPDYAIPRKLAGRKKRRKRSLK